MAIVSKSKLYLAKATAIYNEWERRREDHTVSPPYATANGYLKRSVYELVQTLRLSSGGFGRLERLVRNERNVDPRVPDVLDNPFFWGFLLVFADDECVGRSERSKFAAELLYAHKHGVPAELLIGFIYQVGGYSRIQKKLKAGEMEGWVQEESKQDGN